MGHVHSGWLFGETLGRYQVPGKDAKETANRQPREMKESLRISGVAAIAMDKVTESIATTASQRIRAYCTVVIGNALYQDSGKNARFEGRPRIIKTEDR